MVVSYEVLREQTAKKIAELQAENAKLQAELDSLNSPVKLSEWQQLQVVVDAAKHLVSKYGDELMHRCDVDALEQAIKEVE